MFSQRLDAALFQCAETRDILLQAAKDFHLDSTVRTLTVPAVMRKVYCLLSAEEITTSLSRTDEMVLYSVGNGLRSGKPF